MSAAELIAGGRIGVVLNVSSARHQSTDSLRFADHPVVSGCV